MNHKVQFFKALSDETRQRILDLLEEKEYCVGEIVNVFNLSADKAGMSQPTISHHLNVLKVAGLVKDRKEGQQVYYSLNGQLIQEACGTYFSKFTCCRDLFNNFNDEPYLTE